MVPKVSCSHLEQFVCGLPNVGQSTLKCIIFCFQLLLPSSSWSIIINHEQRLPPIGAMPPQSPLASDCGYLRHGSPWYLYRKHSKFLRRPHWTNKTGFCINFAFRPSHQQIVFIKIVQAQQVGITSYLIFFLFHHLSTFLANHSKTYTYQLPDWFIFWSVWSVICPLSPFRNFSESRKEQLPRTKRPVARHADKHSSDPFHIADRQLGSIHRASAISHQPLETGREEIDVDTRYMHRAIGLSIVFMWNWMEHIRKR